MSKPNPKMKKLTCLQCGNVWEPRKAKPVACPACISRKWNVKPAKATKGKGKVVKATTKKVARPKKVAAAIEKEAA